MTQKEKKANEQKYGTVVFGGKTYILTQQAYCDSYGTDGGVRYYAHAVATDDTDDNEYKVIWDTTEEWDNHQAGGDIHPAEQDDKGDVIAPNEMTCSFCEDESNACDWDKPVEVIEVG